MNYKYRDILASNTLPKEEEAFTHLLASMAADYAEQIGIFINGFSMPEIPIVIAAMKTATTALEYYVQDATGQINRPLTIALSYQTIFIKS